MKKVLLFLFLLFQISCTNPKKVKIDNPDARIYINKLKEGLTENQKKAFESKFKTALMMKVSNTDYSEMSCVNLYSKKCEDLTLGDILYYVKRDN